MPARLRLLRQGAFDNPSMLSLNHNKDDVSPYYGDFLDGSIIGIIRHDDASSYFNFIEAIYIPLAHVYVEKILYDGISVVLGYYPTIFVSVDDYESLFGGNKMIRVASIILLISIRILIGFLLLLIVLCLFHMVRERIKRVRGANADHRPHHRSARSSEDS